MGCPRRSSCALIVMMGKIKRRTMPPCLLYRLGLARPCQHSPDQSYSCSAEPAGGKLPRTPDFPRSLPPLPTAPAQIVRPEPLWLDHFPTGRTTKSPDLQDQVLFFSRPLSLARHGTSMSSATHRVVPDVLTRYKHFPSGCQADLVITAASCA